MPIYEYRCNACRQNFSQLFINPLSPGHVKCKFCANIDVSRIISTFSYHRSEESRLAGLDSSSPQGEEFYKDTRNIGLRTKKRLSELGVNMGPKLDEIIEKGRTGKILEE